MAVELWPNSRLTLLEAPALGVPLVATAVGNLPALIQPGVTGRLAAPTVGSLAQTIRCAWQDPHRLDVSATDRTTPAARRNYNAIGDGAAGGAAGMDRNSTPRPGGRSLTLAWLKRLVERHPALRFALFPIRLKIALSYYIPAVGAVARWLVRSREHTNFTYNYSPASLEYLAHALGLVTGCPVALLRAYLAEPTENVELNRTVRERGEASDRRAVIDRHVRLGKQRIWYALARALKPARIVEAGVGPGLAAVVLAEALLKNAGEGNGGEYLGIDRDPRAGALLGPRQRSVARIIRGESVSTLGGLGQPVDLFITDSHVSADLEYAECRAIGPWLTERAMVGTTVTTRLPAFAEETGRAFLGFKEEPRDHWYPGGWVGLAFRPPPGIVAR